MKKAFKLKEEEGGGGGGGGGGEEEEEEEEALVNINKILLSTINAVSIKILFRYNYYTSTLPEQELPFLRYNYFQDYKTLLSMSRILQGVTIFK